MKIRRWEPDAQLVVQRKGFLGIGRKEYIRPFCTEVGEDGHFVLYEDVEGIVKRYILHLENEIIRLKALNNVIEKKRLARHTAECASGSQGGFRCDCGYEAQFEGA